MTDERLNALIDEIANTNFTCGAWSVDDVDGDDESGDGDYEELHGKATAASDAIQKYVGELHQCIEDLRSQIHQGEADRERLDWMNDKNVVTWQWNRLTVKRVVAGGAFVAGPENVYATDLRAAIDAARSAALSPAKETGNGGAT